MGRFFFVKFVSLTTIKIRPHISGLSRLGLNTVKNNWGKWQGVWRVSGTLMLSCTQSRRKDVEVESGDWGSGLESEEESQKSAMGPLEAAIEKEMPAYFHLKPGQKGTKQYVEKWKSIRPSVSE
jgi:hypothetical protein